MAALGVQTFIIRWMHAVLLEPRQHVKINIIASNWATLNGGMPHGTWLGPYIFLIYINDLQTTLPAFKFIDDVTVIEVIDSIASSQMQTSVDEIVKWSTDNHMNINTSKTKQMIKQIK